MNEKQFEDKFNEMLKDASDIPAPHRDKLMNLARKSRDNHKKLQEKLNKLQESLDYLRLGVKYLIFDLEATRRENQVLKEKLNNSNE